jgi:hypothetical protein
MSVQEACMASTAENNNEVLRRLWNDPDVIELKNSMNEIFPNSVAEGEVVVDNDHLLEAGYLGKPPRFSLGIGRFMFYRSVAIYKDYWIRFHSLSPASYLYSIFKVKK